MNAHVVVVFEGDYAGPEVVREGLKVLREVERQTPCLMINLEHHKIGAAAWDEFGVPITPVTLARATSASAVLLGAVGGPKWASAPVAVESGLGQLRKAMQAFGNLRPVSFLSPSAVANSALKPEKCAGTDIMIVRELTGGMYFGPRQEPDADLTVAYDTDLYTRTEIERVTRLAASLATTSDPPLPVTSLDKANALAATGRLWRSVVNQVMDAEFPSVPLRHILVDSAAMVMACNPTQLNGVVLTSNMFGDIISDVASVIPGSIGLLPSASPGGIPNSNSGPECFIKGLYEPVHGSAPDIAGQGIINPTGMILSVAMMFKYSLNMPEAAAAIESAVRDTMEAGVRTRDLGGSASTSQFGDAVVAALASKYG
ncbi:3-isopropylmalate dehydrogenase-like protein [Colletotrichum falcatum]|nr:3-isopropylmalate dehydrogenase-like protein [Colletotrichum falcatum]